MTATAIGSMVLPRWRVVPALGLGTLMATLDISAVNIALPTLSRTFRLPLTTIEWVVLAYVLSITGLLLTLGRLADRTGRRRVYGIGLAIFTVASGLCAAAPSAGWLIAARATQGLGAAMMTANTSALLIASFPAAERGRALGVFGAMVGVGLALGPPLGGMLIGWSWRWIFLINLPLGLLAQWLLRSRVAPDVPNPAAEPLDLLSALPWSAGLVLLMLGLSRGPTVGWSDPTADASITAAILLLAGFLALERRASAPLLPPAILFGPVGLAVTLTMIGQLLSIGVGIHMPLYFEDVLGFDAARSGRWLAILPVMALLFAPLAGRWSDRWGPGPITVLGLSIIIPGFLALAMMGVSPAPFHVLGALGLVGMGLGLFTVPNASALFGSTPPARLGLVSGLQATMRNLGIALGTALTAGLVASRYRGHGGGHLPGGPEGILKTAFAFASRDFYLVLAAISTAAIALVLRQYRGGWARHAG